MRDHDDEHAIHRAEGAAMLGTILFCALSGAGIGVFVEQPLIGGLIGGAAGILIGLWLVPLLVGDGG